MVDFFTRLEFGEFEDSVRRFNECMPVLGSLETRP